MTAPIEVTGPGVEAGAPTEGAGVSLAVFHATRPGAPEATWYVRSKGERRPLYVVARELGGVVTITSPGETS